MRTRKLPLADRITLLFNHAKGWSAIFVLVVFSLVFNNFWPFLDFKGLVYLRGDLEETKGIITKASYPNFFYPGVDDYWVYDYAFDSPIGPLSYRSYGDKYLGPGKRVTILYHPQNPQLNQIKGMDINPGGYKILLFLLIPVFAFLYLVYTLISGYRKLNLLQKGVISHAVLKSKELTDADYDGKPVYLLNFEYSARDGRKHLLTTRSHLVHKLTDESKELIIYSSRNPQRAIMVDTLPYDMPHFIRYNWQIPD